MICKTESSHSDQTSNQEKQSQRANKSTYCARQAETSASVRVQGKKKEKFEHGARESSVKKKDCVKLDHHTSEERETENRGDDAIFPLHVSLEQSERR